MTCLPTSNRPFTKIMFDTQKIEKARIIKGLTKSGLAKKAGIHPSTYTLILQKPKQNPPHDQENRRRTGPGYEGDFHRGGGGRGGGEGGVMDEDRVRKIVREEIASWWASHTGTPTREAFIKCCREIQQEMLRLINEPTAIRSGQKG